MAGRRFVTAARSCWSRDCSIWAVAVAGGLSQRHLLDGDLFECHPDSSVAATEPHAPSIWRSIPTSMAAGNRPPVRSRNVCGRTESRHSRWKLPDGHDPNSFFVHGGGDARQFQALLERAHS